MSKQKKTAPVPQRARWLIWAIAAGLLVLLASAFIRSWNTNRTLRAELAELQPMATAAMEEQEALKTRLAYVQTDEYVEAWAQAHAGMARSGETLVVPIATTPTPTPLPLLLETPTPTPTPSPFWSQWWQTLVGD
ncbi:MAG: FtsB family cell division protein [Anaerolineae bacterium]